jgi:hypothetical protein
MAVGDECIEEASPGPFFKIFSKYTLEKPLQMAIDKVIARPNDFESAVTSSDSVDELSPNKFRALDHMRLASLLLEYGTIWSVMSCPLKNLFVMGTTLVTLLPPKEPNSLVDCCGNNASHGTGTTFGTSIGDDTSIHPITNNNSALHLVNVYRRARNNTPNPAVKNIFDCITTAYVGAPISITALYCIVLVYA